MPKISLPLIYAAFLVYVALTLFYWWKYRQISKGKLVKVSVAAGVIIATTYCIFAYNVPDFLGYINSIRIMRNYHTDSSFEPIYAWILKAINYNELGFRFCIFIPAGLCLWYLARRYAERPDVFICCFMILGLFDVANLARSSFSDLVGFIGIFAIWQNPLKLKNSVLFIVCTILALTFHKSAFLILLPFAMSFLPLNRRILKFYLFLVPVAMIIANFALDWLFANYTIDEGYTDDSTNKIVWTYALRKAALYISVAVIWIYPLIKLRHLASRHNYNGYLYRFLFFGLLIWISILPYPMSFFVAERVQSHCILPIIMMFAYMTCKANAKQLRTMRICMGGYAIVHLLSAFYILFFMIMNFMMMSRLL